MWSQRSSAFLLPLLSTPIVPKSCIFRKAVASPFPSPILSPTRSRKTAFTHCHTPTMSEPTQTDPALCKPELATMTSPIGHLYFCYGSNMCREKLQSRGDRSTPPIQFEQVWIGRLSGWSLCFDLRGTPPTEPAMASVRQNTGDEVYGLVYKIKSELCWQKLLTSEGATATGGSGDSYFVIEVDVECYEPGKPEEKFVQRVKTLVTNPRFEIPSEMQTCVFPSRRYLDILVNSAEKEGIPEEYIDRLRQYTAARSWGTGLMMKLMVLVIPFSLMSRHFKLRFVTAPITNTGFFLYAKHEAVVLGSPAGTALSLPDKAKLFVIKAVLFTLHGLYAIPAILYYILSPKGRRTARFIWELLMSKSKKPGKTE